MRRFDLLRTTDSESRSVEADRNVAFVLTNALQSKLKIIINLILGAMNNIFHIIYLWFCRCLLSLYVAVEWRAMEDKLHRL